MLFPLELFGENVRWKILVDIFVTVMEKFLFSPEKNRP